MKTGQITFAVRDTVFEDKEIKEGDIIGIHNGRIEVVGKSIHDIALELVKHVVEDGDSLITIYYGQDTRQEDADALGAEVAEMFQRFGRRGAVWRSAAVLLPDFCGIIFQNAKCRAMP